MYGPSCKHGCNIAIAGKKGKKVRACQLKNNDTSAIRRSSGQATDIEIHTKEILLLKERLNKILSQRTGKSVKTIENDTNRDNFMSQNVALKYELLIKYKI